MLAIDTNIFLYAHFATFPDHKKVYDSLKKILDSNQSFCLSWQVCYEYIRVTTHPQALQKPLKAAQALHDLSKYLSHSRCQLLAETPAHEQVLTQIFQKLPMAKGNFIHDCHYAALLYENGVQKILTLDDDFRKFDFLEVVNPLL